VAGGPVDGFGDQGGEGRVVAGGGLGGGGGHGPWRAARSVLAPHPASCTIAFST
jgi:hypothetical protein